MCYQPLLFLTVDRQKHVSSASTDFELSKWRRLAECRTDIKSLESSYFECESFYILENSISTEGNFQFFCITELRISLCFALKLANSALWNILHFNLAPSYDLALKDHWYSRKLFNKLQFTAEVVFFLDLDLQFLFNYIIFVPLFLKTVSKNLMENDLTNNFSHNVVEESKKLHIYGIKITKKYISLPFNDCHVQIWNRHTLLKVEEVYF